MFRVEFEGHSIEIRYHNLNLHLFIDGVDNGPGDYRFGFYGELPDHRVVEVHGFPLIPNHRTVIVDRRIIYKN